MTASKKNKFSPAFFFGIYSILINLFYTNVLFFAVRSWKMKESHSYSNNYSKSKLSFCRTHNSLFFLILIFFPASLFFTFRGREEINYNYIILGQDNICK